MSKPSPDEIVLPEGVSPEHVSVASEVEAFVGPETESNPSEFGRAFNPMNGRYYNETDPGVAPHDTTGVGGALRVNCAYDDCQGFTQVEVQAEIERACPECEAPRMGRAQFSTDSKRQRKARTTVSERVSTLRDPFAIEMDRLTDAGVGPAPAMDYLMCSVGETSVRQWATARGVTERTVKRNMKRVATALGETIEYQP